MGLDLQKRREQVVYQTHLSLLPACGHSVTSCHPGLPAIVDYHQTVGPTKPLCLRLFLPQSFNAAAEQETDIPHKEQ